MNEEELKNVWKQYDNKLEEAKVLNLQSWVLNLQSREIVQSHKSKSELTSLLVNRILEIIFLGVFLIVWGKLLARYASDIPVSISAGVLVIFTLAALYNCILQLAIIIQIKYSESVTGIQKKLASLQIHIVQYLRISLLFIPFYMVYVILAFKIFVNIDILDFSDRDWIKFHLINSAVLIIPAVWLYRTISYKNINKRWVRILINSVGGKSVTNAMGFMKEIDDFKKGI